MPEIRYSDGQAEEQKVLEILQKLPPLASYSVPPAGALAEWSTEYHLCPERGNLLRHFDFSGLSVLELGAGMGGVSRVVAESARRLVVVEGTSARFAALKERLKGLENWEGHVGNVADVSLGEKFDVVLVIGVLEYSELFVEGTSGKSPFIVFLDKAKEHLAPHGVLVLAIENRLGLKYWAGASEDHLGSLFDGLCGYPPGKTAKTFSQQELTEVLATSGLQVLRRYYPFPDYKLPTSVLTDELLQRAPQAAADLAMAKPTRDYLHAGAARFFPEVLAANGLARAGLLGEMANSFLFVASAQAEPMVLTGLLRQESEGDRAWHYASRRDLPTRTRVRLEGAGPAAHAVFLKTPLVGSDRQKTYGSQKFSLQWHATEERASGLESAVQAWLRRAYFDGVEAGLQFLVSYLQWVRAKHALSADRLPGAFVDAVLSNARFEVGTRTFELIDKEWSLDREMAFSWFVLRNLLCVRDHSRCWIGYSNLANVYARVCSLVGVVPEFERDLQLEAELQTLVSPHLQFEEHLAALHECFVAPFPFSGYPRRPFSAAGMIAPRKWLKPRVLGQVLVRVVGRAERQVRTLFFKRKALN